jgi:hypothetical protein
VTRTPSFPTNRYSFQKASIRSSRRVRTRASTPRYAPGSQCLRLESVYLGRVNVPAGVAVGHRRLGAAFKYDGDKVVSVSQVSRQIVRELHGEPHLEGDESPSSSSRRRLRTAGSHPAQSPTVTTSTSPISIGRSRTTTTIRRRCEQSSVSARSRCRPTNT